MMVHATERIDPSPQRNGWRLYPTLGLLLLLTALVAGLVVLGPIGSTRARLAHVQAAVRGAAVTGGPALFVPGGLTARVGELATIPLAFENNGTHVSSLSFSLDYDRDCLRFEPDDQDGNGLPDAISFAVPAQFAPSVMVKTDGRDELHIVIADYGPPFAALPTTLALITVRLRVICDDPALLPRTAVVRFLAQPPVSFGDQNGRDVVGEERGGIVQILPAQAGGTPVPTATRTIAPTAPATPTFVPTAMTPTPTPWVQLEALAAPHELTIDDTKAMIVIDYTVLLPVSDLALRVLLPAQARLNAAASTTGWQCPVSTPDPPSSAPSSLLCHFVLPSALLSKPTSGRLFLAVTLDWLSLPIPTELVFTLDAVSLNQVDRPSIPLVIPVFLDRQTPDNVDLTLAPDRSELLVQSADSATQPTYQLTYQLIYTNRSTLALADVDLHLLLPPATTFHPVTPSELTWNCATQSPEQPSCIANIASLAAGAQQQATFMLHVTQAALPRSQTALPLVAYLTSEAELLGSVSSVVSIRYMDGTAPTPIFLPLITHSAQP